MVFSQIKNFIAVSKAQSFQNQLCTQNRSTPKRFTFTPKMGEARVIMLTHSDIWQHVGGPVGPDAVEMRTSTVHSSQHQSCSDVALVSAEPAQ